MMLKLKTSSNRERGIVLRGVHNGCLFLIDESKKELKHLEWGYPVMTNAVVSDFKSDLDRYQLYLNTITNNGNINKIRIYTRMFCPSFSILLLELLQQTRNHYIIEIVTVNECAEAYLDSFKTDKFKVNVFLNQQISSFGRDLENYVYVTTVDEITDIMDLEIPELFKDEDTIHIVTTSNFDDAYVFTDRNQLNNCFVDVTNEGDTLDVAVQFVFFHKYLMAYYKNVEVISGDDPRCVVFKLSDRFIAEEEDLDISVDS